MHHQQVVINKALQEQQHHHKQQWTRQLTNKQITKVPESHQPQCCC
jgi:hypothetical protein